MGETLLGAIEVISYEEAFPEEILEGLDEIARLAAPALAAAVSYESERNTSLHSISRVTQMYDLEKVFNSTLEMNELLAYDCQEVPGSDECPGDQLVDGEQRRAGTGELVKDSIRRSPSGKCRDRAKALPETSRITASLC